MTDQPTPDPEQAPVPAAKLVFTDPFAQQTSDDTDAAWGESSSRRTLDWYLDQRPPHHGD
ncbi:hypothetical protein [Kitasatospora azatica]|uniref:hypothetical protein n=1 Tax=Kitasatospora azatica TaxID=58347 RepID=UPI00056BC5C4|nr:hypothetical protein [Kitasatospora azatica]